MQILNSPVVRRKEFKLQALELSDEIGVKAAADQLGIKYYTLADWRRQRKARGEEAFVGSGNKMMPLSEKDRRIRNWKRNFGKPGELTIYSRRLSVFSHKAERSESSETF